MSTTSTDGKPSEPQPLPALSDRLGYLLKHARLRLTEITAPALSPLGVTGRECAVLTAIDDRAPLSQQEVASRLAVDRTTMVALIDELERKGFVERKQDPDDRRKNAVALTASGRGTLHRARSIIEDAERRFLNGLTDEESAAFTHALQVVAFADPPGRTVHR